jgi:hypothetical protein
MGADTSGRLLRLVNARVMVDMMVEVGCFRRRIRTRGFARRLLALFVDSRRGSDDCLVYF